VPLGLLSSNKEVRMMQANTNTSTNSNPHFRGRLISQLLGPWLETAIADRREYLSHASCSHRKGSQPSEEQPQGSQLKGGPSEVNPLRESPHQGNGSHSSGKKETKTPSQSELVKFAQEIASPLSIISGAAWGLKEECQPEERQFWIDCILRNALSAQNRVEDLLDEVREEDGTLQLKLTQLDLASVVSEAVTDFVPFAQDNELRFYGDSACILGDQERIKRLVFNLLCSAVNRCEAGREIKVDVWRRAGQVCLFVQDQGQGARPNDNEQIFLPFKHLECAEETLIGDSETAPQESVSLASVKRIAAAHGAVIKVQGTPGHGTIFEVSFKALDHPEK
jgi:K+-sensing histidine kinase KdpD